jgi:hypothetical protein
MATNYIYRTIEHKLEGIMSFHKNLNFWEFDKLSKIFYNSI